jgi:hypothetical protein
MWGCVWPGCGMLYYNRFELDFHFDRHFIVAETLVAASILVGMSK